MGDSLGLSYLRALIPKPTWADGGRPASAARARAERAGLLLDPVLLALYRELCGFTPSTSAPATFPHLAAFPIAMRLMTSRTFPMPVLGLVHAANRITRLRPLEAGMTLNHVVWIETPRDHAKGLAFDVHAEASDAVDGEVVWRSTSTYLRPTGKRGTDRGVRRPPDADESDPGPSEDLWDLPADLGRRYAAISGDRNPIHLYAGTARAFGFPRQIAHGMWTAARSLAALDARLGPLPARFQFDVGFNAAVPLPSTVRFHAWARPGTGSTPGSSEFELWDSERARRHLRGSLVPL